MSGSADLTGALLGEDLFHRDAFAWNVIAYFIIASVAWFVVRKAMGGLTA